MAMDVRWTLECREEWRRLLFLS